MRKRGVERSPLPVRAEINVTSLVDVAFTLLVIFIITAPVMQGGIEVNLPRGQVGYIEASDKLLDVTVRPPDSIFFGELPVTRDEAPAALRQLIRAQRSGGGRRSGGIRWPTTESLRHCWMSWIPKGSRPS